jgi:hypothetical protein
LTIASAAEPAFARERHGDASIMPIVGTSAIPLA